jgi:hypothetical protein
MTATLHARVRAAIEHRLALARAATPGPWDAHAISLHMDGSGTYRIWPPGQQQILNSYMRNSADAIHISCSDPASVLALCEGALRILDRHAPIVDSRGHTICDDCDEACHWREYEADDRHHAPWPCPNYTDLAAMFGVPEEDGDG